MQLLSLRTTAGWSQELLARKMDVSRQTVMNWEDGKSIPTADKAIRLAKIFGVTVEELMEEKIEQH